jgi:predicted membrane protein
MRTILAVLILFGAAWRIGADWQATIGQGYAFRPDSIGALVAARWPESHARLLATLGDGLGQAVGGFVLALPAALVLAAFGCGLWITRARGRRG